MAYLCLDASLETFWPLCCRRMLHHWGDLCHCLHKGSPQVLQCCSNVFAMPCPPKWPIVYYPGFWGLHSPKANSRCWWRPEGSSAAIPELSWPSGQELSPAGEPFLTTKEGHVKTFHNSLLHVLLIHSDTSFTPFLQKMKVVTELMARPGISFVLFEGFHDHYSHFTWGNIKGVFTSYMAVVCCSSAIYRWLYIEGTYVW